MKVLGIFSRLNGSTFKITTTVLVALILSWAANGAFSVVPGPKIEISGSKNHVSVAREPEVQCPTNWLQTRGNPFDASAGSFTSCESPTKRYIITFREGSPPAGLDTIAAKFLTSDEIAALLR